VNPEGGYSKPVLIYLTSTDKKIVKKVRNYEKGALVDEKYYIAARFFDCYMVDVANIEKGHPLLTLVKKPKPMSFITVSNGRVLYKTNDKPSSSNIFSVCAKTLKKTHKFDLEKITKEEQEILSEISALNDQLEKIKNTRLQKNKKLSKREGAALTKEEETIQKKMSELREAESKLMTLPSDKKGKVAKK
jgi:hypothetical protein